MPDHFTFFPEGGQLGSFLYGLFVMCGLLLSLCYWSKMSKGDSSMLMVYFGAIAGAFLGAKIAYLIAEGWLHTGPGAWRHWAVGKSVTGALLGGFLGVEIVKRMVGYKKPTGDKFALVIPMGIIIGRLGCLSHGCCGGIIFENGVQWPAVPVEIGFNVIIWYVMYQLFQRQRMQNQLFHFYLMTYGVFRFSHEFLRVTPKVILGLSGYQWIALLMAVIGVIAYKTRQQKLLQNKLK